MVHVKVIEVTWCIQEDQFTLTYMIHEYLTKNVYLISIWPNSNKFTSI